MTVKVSDITPDIEVNDEELERVHKESDVVVEEAPEVVDEKVEEKEDILHIIEPKHEPVDVVLSFGGHTRTYTQKPLTYFKKMEFFQLVGRTLDEAMKGDDGLNVNSIFGGPQSVTDLSTEDFADLDSFLNMVAKIARYAPEFLKECYLVWLGIPKAERVWAREALDEIDEEIGFEIIERFIDQNWEALEGFFSERVPSLLQRVAKHRKSS